jgi:membrane-associated phospholipid phosphatase
MLYWFGMLFAIIGASAILFALGFVTLVIGGLVNGMVALMSGPLIDRIANRRGRSVSPA